MPPKPQFFVVRPGLEKITSAGELIVQPGTLVPLIPIDLLPEWVDIVGVPRELSAEQTTGMTYLGPFHVEKEGYQMRFLQAEEDTSQGHGEVAMEGSVVDSPERSASPPQQTSRLDPSGTPTPCITSRAAQHIARGLECSRHNPLNAPVRPPNSPTPPPAARPTKTTTTTTNSFCRHWCHHGTCKWGLQCRYQHNMPSTAEGLADVGLKDFPAWWRTAMEMAMGIPFGMYGVAGATATTRKVIRQKKQKRMQTAAEAAQIAEDRVAVAEDDEMDDDADDEGGSVPATLPETEEEEEALIDL
ncbi:hypothetical protein G7046_g8667 [Stylonectria norvegica]|nr:hypothetical protein G7046_g8667 [Stylonectria norvegica]